MEILGCLQGSKICLDKRSIIWHAKIVHTKDASAWSIAARRYLKVEKPTVAIIVLKPPNLLPGNAIAVIPTANNPEAKNDKR